MTMIQLRDNLKVGRPKIFEPKKEITFPRSFASYFLPVRMPTKTIRASDSCQFLTDERHISTDETLGHQSILPQEKDPITKIQKSQRKVEFSFLHSLFFFTVVQRLYFLYHCLILLTQVLSFNSQQTFQYFLFMFIIALNISIPRKPILVAKIPRETHGTSDTPPCLR